MASIVPNEKGFRAFVWVGKKRSSKQCRTRREANTWAAAKETELRAQEALPAGAKHTLQEAFDRFEREVLPGHKGQAKERIRLAALARQLPVSLPISQITTEVLSAWRNARAKEVKGSTVLRDIKLLNPIFDIARREWKWITTNPLTDVSRPRAPRHRTRTIKRFEIRRQLKEMGYSRQRVSSMSEAICIMWLLALRTGMRASEICNLTWDRVFAKHLHVEAKGIGETTRDVPTNWKTRRLLERMRGWDKEMVFGVQASTLDTLFRRYRKRAGLSGYTFHDSRHTAATWLARRLDVLTLCKMFGWSDPKQAMVYFNPTAEDIADSLD